MKFGMFTQRMAIAVRKNSTLRAALDQALVAAQADGTVNRLITQYLNVSAAVPPPALPSPVSLAPPITPSTPMVAGSHRFPTSA